MAGWLVLSRWIDTLNRKIGRAMVWPVLGAILVSAGNAVGRYWGGLLSDGFIDAVGNTRLVLQPAGDPEAFQKLGLRPGDMIVAIDNQEVADDFAAGLDAIASLEGRQSVTISVERDGVVMPVRIALPNTVSMPND